MGGAGDEVAAEGVTARLQRARDDAGAGGCAIQGEVDLGRVAGVARAVDLSHRDGLDAVCAAAAVGSQGGVVLSQRHPVAATESVLHHRAVFHIGDGDFRVVGELVAAGAAGAVVGVGKRQPQGSHGRVFGHRQTVAFCTEVAIDVPESRGDGVAAIQ